MFLPNKFRIAQNSDSLKDAFRKYINHNYTNLVFDNTSNFINEFIQTRNMVGSFNPKEATEEKLKLMITNCLTYIKVIEKLIKRVKLGRDSDSLSLKFYWKEVTTGKETSSYNVNYEICSVKFNLAICFSLLGFSKVKSTNAELLKESVKNFEKAAYLFNEIKVTVTSKGLAKENIPDFYDSYLESCYNYSLGMAQICVYTISKIKAFSSELRAKLAMGASDIFTKIVNSSLSNNLDKSLVIFYSTYYRAVAYDEARLTEMEEFDKFGKGIGKALGYSSLVLEELKKCNSLIKAVSKYINEASYRQLKDDNELFFPEKSKQNTTIYRDPIPPKTKLIIEGLVSKVTPIPLTEVGGNFNSIMEINNLTPPELKPIIGRYIEEMNKYAKIKLREYESEETINDFLEKKNIPEVFSKGIGAIKISDMLFSNLQAIQAKGGLEYLTNGIAQIDAISQRVNEIISSLDNKMILEIGDDNKNRILYGNEWLIEINPDYINKLTSYKSKLSVAKDLDLQLKTSVANNTKYYELLGLPKNIIESRIPSGKNIEQIKALPSTQALKFAVNKLLDDKAPIILETKEIFLKICDALPLIELGKVLKGQRNERLVVEDEKSELEPNFKKIAELSEVIKSDYADINSKYEEFYKSCGGGVSEEAQQYLDFLNKAESEFNTTMTNIDNSLTFYQKMEDKVKDFSNDLEGYLFARNIEKEELIERLQTNERYKLAQNSVSGNGNFI